MQDASVKYKDMLKPIKKNIQASHAYFQRNNRRFHEFMKFVFDTSLTSDDISKLTELLKPTIECNILESMISRLIEEFAAQEPSITARAEDGMRVEDITPEFNQLLDVISNHLRHIFRDSNHDAVGKKIIRDMLGGGYSVARVYTDYVNEMSFEQNIRWEKVFDSTLTGFDPLARESHKGDGSYCFELYPRTKEEFEEEYGKDAAKGFNFSGDGSIEGFRWSYLSQQQKIVLVADYYFKVKKKEKIVKLSNGHIVLKKHYKQFLDLWNEQRFIEQAPIIIEERSTMVESIERFQVCEDRVLRHEKTSFKMFPLVFFDGNSAYIQELADGATYQMTRPVVYQAKGVQKLKNFAVQTIAAEIENMVMHKFILSVESIPKGYEDAYKNVQLPSNIIYNAYYKEDPNKPLEPPREVQRTQTPSIVENVFMGADQTAQTILGNYDNLPQNNAQDLSGKAIMQGAMRSSSSASPYLLGYIDGLNRVAQIVCDLIPKFYKTPRSLPVIGPDGKRSYQIINHQGNEDSIDIYYDPNGLQVKIEAGVSNETQKQIAMEQIIRLSAAIPEFGNFINTMGLETILDNLDIRGIEKMKEQAGAYMKMKQEQMENQKGDPMVEIAAQQVEVQKNQGEMAAQIEAEKVKLKAEKDEGDLAIQAAKVANEKQKTDIKFMEVMLKAKVMEQELDMEQERIDSENARTAVESALEIAKHHHGSTMDVAKHMHDSEVAKVARETKTIK
jgi:hypothetical protein